MSKATEPVPVPATEKPWQHRPGSKSVGPIVGWRGLWAQLNPSLNEIQRGGVDDEDVAREEWGNRIDDTRAFLILQDALRNSGTFQSMVEDEGDEWQRKGYHIDGDDWSAFYGDCREEY